MRIVFYCTNSNVFAPEDLEQFHFPTRRDDFEKLERLFPEHEFFIVAQLPAPFLVDLDSCTSGGSLAPSAASSSVGTHPHAGTPKIYLSQTTGQLTETILQLHPDLAIAATFWAPPFDWLGLQDSLTAEELRKNNIPVLSHSADTQMECFDKYRTRQVLERLNLPVPPAVYVHHELFWCERGRREITSNVYKNYLQQKIEQLPYPVVVKDTQGLSSYGMEVSVSPKQVFHYLKSGKTTSDRLVEQYLQGLTFGTEIYSANKRHTVMPPFLFSLNRYGITSPKRSIKAGPVSAADFPQLHLDRLQSMLTLLAEHLNLNGITQVDLIFSNDEWYIIDINPRISGMTQTYAAAMDMSVPELLARLALQKDFVPPPPKAAVNFKIEALDPKLCTSLSKEHAVSCINLHHNLAARQEREKGYCELIATAASIPELLAELENLSQKNPESITQDLFSSIRNLCGTLWC